MCTYIYFNHNNNIIIIILYNIYIHCINIYFSRLMHSCTTLYCENAQDKTIPLRQRNCY